MEPTQGTAIRALAEPMLAERHAELVELAFHPQGRGQLIRFLVDRVGGITLQQCAQLNQAIAQALEAANLIEGPYTIEVSSPGLDRPLVTKRDFERALGERLRLQLTLEAQRTKDLEGVLLAVQEQAIVLNTVSGNVTIPLADIRTAKKAMRW